MHVQLSFTREVQPLHFLTLQRMQIVTSICANSMHLGFCCFFFLSFFAYNLKVQLIPQILFSHCSNATVLNNMLPWHCVLSGMHLQLGAERKST